MNIATEIDSPMSVTYKHFKTFARQGWVTDERETVRYPDFDASIAGRPERVLNTMTDHGRAQLTTWRQPARPRTRQR
jgi:hypothetical protein